nr:MAG TPA: hypothetical protein [Caudoviricetes sp.]
MSDRSCGHFCSQLGSYQRNRRESAICKNAFKNAECHPLFL